MEPIPGSVPSLLRAARGCRYAQRCPLVSDKCRSAAPRMMPVEPAHAVACFAVEDARARAA